MVRVFGELELGYLQEVLTSGKLGWHHEPESMTARLVPIQSAIRPNSYAGHRSRIFSRTHNRT